MMIRSDVAKYALPFPEKTVYDHWLSIVAATQGEIFFSDRCLVSYRQHEHNQTGVLHNVNTKEDYKREKVDPLEERLKFYKRMSKPSKGMEEFIYSRINMKRWGIWKNRRFSLYEALWEILISYFPDKIYLMIIETIKR